ncbi:hypothetical protein AML91_01430 [Paenibacillus jilunlii]|uniref:Uncharacterized protein n=1 Tax=Paenibacillus jilunlii TaxID=682956 RepID=A0ABR5T132_9BACL|nr:hypothetical protein AML91_01430 [Paenibacillus jilunlii]
MTQVGAGNVLNFALAETDNSIAAKTPLISEIKGVFMRCFILLWIRTFPARRADSRRIFTLALFASTQT